MKRNKVTSNNKTQQIYQFFPKKQKQDSSLSDFYSEYLPQQPKEAEPVPQIESTIEQENKCEDETVQNINCENEQLKKENQALKLKIEKIEADNRKLKDENQTYVKDLKSLKKLYNQACNVYVKKDIQIKLLEQKCVPSGRIYENHKDSLGESVLNAIRKLKGCKRNDSTFILKIIQKLYEGETHKLTNKTACGREGKSFMSPNKRTIIDELFLERLSNESLEDGELHARYSRLNELTNFAINNITRKISKQNVTSTKTTPVDIDPSIAPAVIETSNAPTVIETFITQAVIVPQNEELIQPWDLSLNEIPNLHLNHFTNERHSECITAPPPLHFFEKKQLSFDEF